MVSSQAFIGRPFVQAFDHKNRVTRCQLDKINPVLIDYGKPQHTFIVAKSGGGKSYLAGVLAEEFSRVMENYCTLLVDPMGIFSTLKVQNTKSIEIDQWNEQCPGEIIPRAVEKCTVWVPAGDAEQFLPGTFDKTFSIKARDLSQGGLCYAFDLDILDPQPSLFRKCQMNLCEQRRPDYTLGEFIAAVHEQGHGLGFQAQTVEALCTKLGALDDLGIVRGDAPEIHDVLGEGAVAVLDLSQSSQYTAKIIINFLAERLLSLRHKIKRMIQKAETTEELIDKPAWYVPPCQIVIDEAQDYVQKNPMLKKVIKTGRNCKIMMTTISQSPDLTKDVYANITHVLVGPLVYEEDILAVKAMLPIETSPKEFKQKVHNLTTGTFLYYNVDAKTEQLIKVRPRRTLHPASTDLKDERKYFKKQPSEPQGNDGDTEVDYYAAMAAELEEMKP